MHKNSHNNVVFLDQNSDHKRSRNTLKFTDLSIKHLKPKSKRIIYWCEGMTEFGVRMSPKGSKAWVYEYRFNNKSRRMTLGTYPKVTLAEATKLFSESRIMVAKGIDPLNEREKNNREYDEAINVRDLASQYIEFCIIKGEKSWKEKKRVINKELVPIIGDNKARDITFRDIAKIINGVYVIRNKPVQAQRLLSHARCMFKYAKNFLGAIDINPCADLDVIKPRKRHKRALSTKEIYCFWHKLSDARMMPVTRLGLKFMLCTMARGIEVRNAKWDHINLADKTWFIPSENAKNGREILLPLNHYALEILEEARRFTSHSVFAFGWNPILNDGQKNPRDHELKPMAKDAFSHAMRDNFAIFGVEERFTPHDLRRTGATCLTSVSYPKEWVSKLLNHTPSDITSMVYDTFDYFEEKKAGMDAIQYILEAILKAKSIEYVPSLQYLRKQFLSKKLIYQFLENCPVDVQKNNKLDFQANFSNPVSYNLSYDHIGLRI